MQAPSERPLELLRRLIAFPTLAGGPNAALIEWVADLLEGAGADVATVAGPRADARNLHARLGPSGDRSGGILLAAHTDVVPVDGQSWTSDPFVLTRRGDRLLGRGTTDMKGFVAAVLTVVLDPSRGPLREPLHIALSCDEELGCRGVPSLLDHLAAAGVRPRLCIVGEPTRMAVVQAHKGKIARRVVVRGHACHSSRPWEGVNAVAFAARLIGEIDDLARTLDRRASLSVGPISGGVALNVVPDRCSFEFELRSAAGVDHAALLNRVDAAASCLASRMGPTGSITMEPLSSYPALAPQPDGRAATEVAAAAGTRCGEAVDYGTEAGLYQQRLEAPVVVCGPGDMGRAHKADEYLEVRELLHAVRFVERLLAGASE